MRIGPFARDGSTARPPCEISTKPFATNRLAALRVRSISGFQLSGETARAASEGQMVVARPEWATRDLSRVRMASARASSRSLGLVRRQASEQYFT